MAQLDTLPNLSEDLVASTKITERWYSFFNRLSNFTQAVQPTSKFKLVQSAVTSSIALTNDPELVMKLAAGTYKVEALLQFQGSVTGTQGISLALNYTGTRSGNSWLTMRGIANAVQLGDTLFTSLTTTVNFATISTALADFVFLIGAFRATSSGIFSLQWGQRNLSANATLLNGSSWLRAVQTG